MQVRIGLPDFLRSHAPEVGIEPRLAAFVAKLRQQASAYEGWSEAMQREADPAEQAHCRRAYDHASGAVREALDALCAVAQRTSVPPNPAVRALRACVRDLQVAHLRRLRDDDVVARSDLKIASRLAYLETLGTHPNAGAVASTQEARVDATRQVAALNKARERAESYADREILEAVGGRKNPTYVKPAGGILKPSDARLAARKSVRWDDAATAFSKHLETATDYASDTPA